MLADLLRRTVKSAAAQGDPYYSAISLLLPMDGTNGSTTFTDKSLNGLTVTANGSAQISTAQSKFGGASGYFDGSTGYASAAYSSLFAFPGDFTVEFWINFSSHASYGGMVCNATAVTSWVGWNIIFNSTSNNIRVEINNGGATIVSSVAMTPGVWNHVALIRKGSSVILFLNGTSVGSATYANAIDSGSAQLVVGAERQKSSFSNCYIDDLAIYKGVAIYPASGFTPPTKAHATFEATVPADAYYSSNSLLLHMDGTNGSTSFVDSGPNALAVTATGTAAISTTQSKFGGASGSFNGTSSYVTLPLATPFTFGTGDFTIEFWLYVNSSSGVQVIYDSRPITSGGLYPTVYYYGGAVRYYQNQVDRIISSSISLSTWYHVAIVRSSSTTKMYLNGTQTGSSYSDSNNYSCGSGRPWIGADSYNGGLAPANYFNGYIDDFRVTKGYARYTSNFTPPTKALPNLYNPYTTLPVSGAALWLDASQQNTLFTDAGVNAVTKSGDLVYQWNDLSGNNRHATQATSGNRPTWSPPASGQNGFGAVSFNGSSSYLISSGSGQSGAFTVYLVFTRTNATGTQIPLEWGTQTTGNWRSFQSYYGNTTTDGGLYFAGYFRDLSATTLTASYSTCSLMSVSYDGTTTTIRRDSGSASGTPVLNTISTLDINIGRSVLNSYFLSGKVMEVIVFPTGHNSTQYSQVRSYCQSKWGTP